MDGQAFFGIKKLHLLSFESRERRKKTEYQERTIANSKKKNRTTLLLRFSPLKSQPQPNKKIFAAVRHHAIIIITFRLRFSVRFFSRVVPTPPPGALISVRIIVLCLGKRGRGTFFKKNSGGVASLFSVIQPEKAEEDFKNPSVPKTNLGENIRILHKTK